MRPALFARPVLVLFLLACAAVRGAEGTIPRDELLIAPKQDLEMLKSAWMTKVKVDYRNTDLRAVVADLAKQSGIAIKLHPNVPADSNPSLGIASSQAFGWYGRQAPSYRRAEHFLGRKEADQLTGTVCTFRFENGRIQQLRADKPVPLTGAIEWLLNGLLVSFRSDGIVIGTAVDLMPELLVTRSYRLDQDWGTEYKLTHNGVPYVHRLNLLDSVAWALVQAGPSIGGGPWNLAGPDALAHLRDTGANGNPAGAYDRLARFGNGLAVSYDKDTRTLKITALPQSIERFEYSTLPALQKVAPETRAEQAKSFKQRRTEQAGKAAWKLLDAGGRAELERLAKALDADAPAARNDAERKLAQAGLAAAVALGNLDDQARSLELRQRGKRVLDAAYQAYEIAEIRARAEAYLKAGQAGDLEGIRKTFWTEERNAQHESKAKAFDEELAAAKESATLPDFRKQYSFPANTPPEQMSYAESVRRGLLVQDARIEGIECAGGIAVVTFSMKLPLVHPQTALMKQLKDEFGIAQPVEKFSLVFDGQRWMAGGDGEFADEEKLSWSRTKEIPRTDMTSTSTSLQENDAGDSVTLEAGASAIAYSLRLGY